MSKASALLRGGSKRLVAGFGVAVMAVATIVSPMAVFATQTVSIEGDVKVANVTAGDTTYSDSVNASVDQVVKVQVWYHNRENFGSEKLAKNLKVGINIPTAPGKSQTVTATVSSDTSNTVTETAKVNLSLDNAYLEYIPGSAKWRSNQGIVVSSDKCKNNDPNQGYVTTAISDAVVTGGVVVGDLKPCFAYESTVTVLARVKASEIKVNKYVSESDGDRDVKNNKWVTKNSVKPSTKLDYMIRFENKGNTTLKNVIVGDNLPDYMEYIPGSTYIYNTNNPGGMAANTDNVYKGGINVGSYAPGSTGYVVFSVKVNDKNKFAQCGVYTLKNVGVVRPEGMNEFYNTAVTDVTLVCAQGQTPRTPETPASTEAPAEIPSTGPADMFGAALGASSLTGASYYWLRSRRFMR